MSRGIVTHIRSALGGLLLVAVVSALLLLPPMLSARPAPAATPSAVAAGPVSQPAASQATLTVFAASSLTDAFKELGTIFELHRHGSVSVTFSFGASSQLRTQLEQGAPADVFASAGQDQLDRARRAGVIAGPDIPFVANRLVVIVPRSNPAAIQTVADLGRPGVKIVTAAPEVPIGAYTQRMFETMSQIETFGPDFMDRANANIVSREPNVRQIVAKIQLGEGDAAVVYRSDVTPQFAPDLLVIPIPDDLNTIATYPIALVADATQAELGAAFIELVLSPVGQGVLQKWNFTPVGPTALVPAPSMDTCVA
jgi:molybdate transport system substrate-binding protein